MSSATLSTSAQSKALIPLVTSATTANYRDYQLRLGSWTLEHGQLIPSANLACRLYGNNHGPIYVVLGGISSSRQICDDSSDQKGWWNNFVGPGKTLDTRYCRVLGVDFLGSGDSTQPRHLTEWAITPADQAHILESAWRQLQQQITLPEQIDGLIGASYGGMVALHWAQLYPHSIARALVLCAAHRSNPSTSAYRSLQRRIVRFAHAQGNGEEGLRLARGLAMLGFRSTIELNQRFAGLGQVKAQQLVLPIDHYLAARGADYAQRHNPASFHCLSQSCDLHHLQAANINTELWLLACESDAIVPLADVKELADQAPNVRYFQNIQSIFGHDSFLKQTIEVRQALSNFHECARLASHQQDLAFKHQSILQQPRLQEASV